MKKYIYTILAVAAVFSSCSKSLELNEDINSDSKVITSIGASTELSTRAVVSSTDNAKVNWESEDQLGVLGTNGSSEAKNLAYTLASGTGSTSGTFSNSSSDITTISAVMYPYQSTASWDGTNSKLTCEIPPVQTATKGSFDKAAAIMYSIGNPSTANVALNYAVNFLKVTIGTSDTGIHSITISSSSTELSGKMEITSSSITPVSGQSLKSVTLTAGKNITFEPGDYYIAVKAGDIVTPSISIIHYESGNKAKEYAKPGSGGDLKFTNGNIKLITVDFSSILTATYATGREAVQLWKDGPYWAKCNVGATSESEAGGYYTWGGTYNNNPDLSGYKWTDDHYKGIGSISGSDDTAAKLWGASWRMPTSAEFESLLSAECSKEKIFNEDENGNKVFISVKFSGTESYSSNNVSLPAVGNIAYNNHSSISNKGSCGYYWSSTPDSSYGLYLQLLNTNDVKLNKTSPSLGHSVRAVLE